MARSNSARVMLPLPSSQVQHVTSSDHQNSFQLSPLSIFANRSCLEKAESHSRLEGKQRDLRLGGHWTLGPEPWRFRDSLGLGRPRASPAEKWWETKETEEETGEEKSPTPMRRGPKRVCTDRTQHEISKSATGALSLSFAPVEEALTEQTVPEECWMGILPKLRVAADSQKRYSSITSWNPTSSLREPHGLRRNSGCELGQDSAGGLCLGSHVAGTLCKRTVCQPKIAQSIKLQISQLRARPNCT